MQDRTTIIIAHHADAFHRAVDRVFSDSEKGFLEVGPANSVISMLGLIWRRELMAGLSRRTGGNPCVAFLHDRYPAVSILLISANGLKRCISRDKLSCQVAGRSQQSHGAGKAMECGSVVLDLDVKSPTRQAGKPLRAAFSPALTGSGLEYLLSPIFSYRMGSTVASMANRLGRRLRRRKSWIFFRSACSKFYGASLLHAGLALPCEITARYLKYGVRSLSRVLYGGSSDKC